MLQLLLVLVCIALAAPLALGVPPLGMYSHTVLDAYYAVASPELEFCLFFHLVCVINKNIA